MGRKGGSWFSSVKKVFKSSSSSKDTSVPVSTPVQPEKKVINSHLHLIIGSYEMLILLHFFSNCRGIFRAPETITD